jgi:hypothetical protein
MADGFAVDGAGLYNNGGIVTIDYCSLFGNIVDGGGGGGIYNGLASWFCQIAN